jgi:hypothetical protein
VSPGFLATIDSESDQRRCARAVADPIAYDMEHTRDLGYCATEYLLSGGNAVVIAMDGGQLLPIPFRELLDPAAGRVRIRVVDVRSTRYAIARRHMVRLRRDDFDDAHELARYTATCRLSVEEFRREFSGLVEAEPPALSLDLVNGQA